VLGFLLLEFGSWNLLSTIGGYEDLGMWECEDLRGTIYEVRFWVWILGFGIWNLGFGTWDLELGTSPPQNPTPKTWAWRDLQSRHIELRICNPAFNIEKTRKIHILT
jgi:hypothetical protein